MSRAVKMPPRLQHAVRRRSSNSFNSLAPRMTNGVHLQKSSVVRHQASRTHFMFGYPFPSTPFCKVVNIFSSWSVRVQAYCSSHCVDRYEISCRTTAALAGSNACVVRRLGCMISRDSRCRVFGGVPLRLASQSRSPSELDRSYCIERPVPR